jgi:hypothetical protein
LFSLLQSSRVRGSAGEPLPPVFTALENKGIIYRKGQLCLICAGPGTGKSGFALTHALKSRVPSMYYSADSDAFVQLQRSISIETGSLLEDSAKAILEGALDKVNVDFSDIPIRFSYDASPNLDEIEDSIESYSEVYGTFPDLIIVDNITNVRTDSSDGDDPFSGLESLMDYLHTMARATEACVVGLHHVTGPYNDANKPIPLSGVKGQITRVPEMVLTLFKPGPDTLGVSAVKNRGGKADASGNDYAELEFIGESMTIRDYTNVQRQQEYAYEQEDPRGAPYDPWGDD